MSQCIEKEVKILDIQKSKLIKKLESLWAVKQYEEHIHDTYYDFHDAGLEQEKKRVRIRRKWATTYVTLKKNHKTTGYKSCDEHEFTVACPEQTHQTFSSHGLMPKRSKKKHRVSYTYKSMTFDIDTYEHVPPLLEIEWPTQKKIQKRIKKLWLSNKEQAACGARWLFKRYELSANSSSAFELIANS